MLDDRSKLLLKALVERYIADGQPVGSRTLSKASGLELSPATIRNVMSDLEELGLIVTDANSTAVQAASTMTSSANPNTFSPCLWIINSPFSLFSRVAQAVTIG